MHLVKEGNGAAGIALQQLDMLGELFIALGISLVHQALRAPLDLPPALPSRHIQSVIVHPASCLKAIGRRKSGRRRREGLLHP